MTIPDKAVLVAGADRGSGVEAMQGRVLGRLPWLAAAMSSGDHLDQRIGPGEFGVTPRSR
jgi:hypothetical protein